MGATPAGLGGPDRGLALCRPGLRPPCAAPTRSIAPGTYYLQLRLRLDGGEVLPALGTPDDWGTVHPSTCFRRTCGCATGYATSLRPCEPSSAEGLTGERCDCRARAQAPAPPPMPADRGYSPIRSVKVVPPPGRAVCEQLGINTERSESKRTEGYDRSARRACMRRGLPDGGEQSIRRAPWSRSGARSAATR